MLENIDTVIRPVMGDIRIVVYDLGLNETERQKVFILTHLFRVDTSTSSLWIGPFPTEGVSG